MKKANELHLITETLRGHTVTEEQLIKLQKEFESRWTKVGIFLDLTDEHFVQQLRRVENRHHPISLPELKSLLDVFTSKHQDSVINLNKNSYGVIREEQTSTNLVFFVDHDSKYGYEKDIRMVTVMRKTDFYTHDSIYEVKLN